MRSSLDVDPRSHIRQLQTESVTVTDAQAHDARLAVADYVTRRGGDRGVLAELLDALALA